MTWSWRDFTNFWRKFFTCSEHFAQKEACLARYGALRHLVHFASCPGLIDPAPPSSSSEHLSFKILRFSIRASTKFVQPPSMTITISVTLTTNSILITVTYISVTTSKITWQQRRIRESEVVRGRYSSRPLKHFDKPSNHDNSSLGFV